ncbi:TetR/AcrR family transcriptional regulator C-terminal domain-containing protein [Streptomyces sp. A30]|uniref:TetR/AcrR family transcriptional regulator C-terminal domain-containing protein n=1 Tax=Streptomyces sp. A30 TaxID=2789273 RepID=UPI00397FB310
MSKVSSDPSPPDRSRAPAGLTYERVLASAMEVLDEEGLDGLSLRRVADRLGVRVNTVAWHVKDKARLLRAMSDDLLRDCVREALPPDPDERIFTLIARFRQGLLSRRDGGRLWVEGRALPWPNHLVFGEALTGALLETGRGPRDTAWATWTLVYFTSGLVQEQQSPADGTPGAPVDNSSYPALALTEPYLGDSSFDARFTYGLTLILNGNPGAATGNT